MYFRRFYPACEMPRETSEAVEIRHGQILDGHDQAEHSTRQANLETTWRRHGTLWLPDDWTLRLPDDQHSDVDDVLVVTAAIF